MPTDSRNSLCVSLLLAGLTVLAGASGTVQAEPGRCGAKVLLTDPAANLRDATVAPGAATAVGAAARVSVAPEAGAAKPPLVVWENGQGQFRKAVSGASPLPSGAVRLYVLAALGENDELRAFDEALSEEFGDAPKPSFMPGGGEGAPATGRRRRKPRGVDDDVKPHRPSSLPGSSRRTTEPPAGEAAAKPEAAANSEVLACAFEFSGAAAGGEGVK